MKHFAVNAIAHLILALSSNGAVAKSGDQHPVERVILMLQGLSAKAEVEGKQEALLYEKFEYWCRNSGKTLSDAIKEEKETIDSLKSQIEAKEEQEDTLKDQIDQLAKQIANLDATSGTAETNREEGAGIYAETSADFNSTIKAIADAIKELELAKGGAALAQVLGRPRVRTAMALAETTTANEAQRGVLAALLQDQHRLRAKGAQRPQLKAEGDYEAHIKKYNFKSDDVIELLKGLKAQFEVQLLDAVKAETNAINNYDLAKQARDAEKSAAEGSKSQKETMLGTVQDDLVQLRQKLKDTEDDLSADTATLDQTQQACAVKRREWEERSSVRAQEREAMDVAVKILAKVTGVRTTPPENPLPPTAPGVNFLQLSQDPRVKAVNLLRKAARISHSKALQRLAEQLSMQQGAAFDQVINMIEKMIFRLMNEQKEEDNHKDWCDQELMKSSTSQGHKTDKIEELRVRIAKDASTMTVLVQDITAAQDMIKATTEFMKEATEIRQVGKRENAEALKDAQDAQNAIAEATSVIEAFYKETGMITKQPWELLQAPVQLPDSPDTWGSSYTGVTDPQKQPAGIVTVLNKVGSEFAKMEADTRA
eukprot:CAMPEP_0179152246 /NCGR_PEP_ID=MMETSP0796-20121207/73974_1 /TAXON_ID=73915 /ORGANISM="Pyrodinium bahamense, Strain pbaha01" /LENGTH=596 /DNA_ID=CAMNT_0020853437 /DNA_START=56 /DNA_END=1842 /DNA_ORIENTATION=+